MTTTHRVSQRTLPLSPLTPDICLLAERFNETMVNAFSLYVLSVCHVCGSYQCPYCPIFSGASSLTVPFALLTLILLLKPLTSCLHRRPL